jgi:rod shape-determining protein MreC
MASACLHGLAATATGLLLLAVSPGSPGMIRAVEFAAVVLDIPERPAHMMRGLVSEGALWFSGMRGLKERLRELELDNVRLRSTLQERPDLRVPDRKGLVPCLVDLRPPSSWWRELRVDRGFADGVREGMPALQDGFLAGRVFRVHGGHSWVELITSPSLLVPVVVDETRDLGVLAGDGTGRINLLYIPEEKVIAEGSMIRTALASDSLPAGLPVGKISPEEPMKEGGFKVYRVIPGADLSKMYSLYILAGGGEEE